MFRRLGVAGTTQRCSGEAPPGKTLQAVPADAPHGRHRGVPTRGTPGTICGFGAGHEIQDTLDIPSPLPAVVCCWFWMPFRSAGKTDSRRQLDPPAGSWPNCLEGGTDSSDDRLRRPGDASSRTSPRSPGPWPAALKAAAGGISEGALVPGGPAGHREQEGAGHRNPDFCQPL